MATVTVKTTCSLDVETERELESLARRWNSAMTDRACEIGSRPAGRICTLPRETGSKRSHSPPGECLARARLIRIGCSVFIRSRAGSITALAAATMGLLER